MNLFLFYVASSLIIGFLGYSRRFGFWGHFFCSLALTPFVGAIVLIASAKKKK